VFHRLDISAWFDEAYSYGMSTQSWQSFFSRWVWGSESNMFLYYLILRGWLGLLKLVGAAPNEVLLRLPSVLFAVAAAVVVFLLGRRLFGRIAGLVAGGLFLANFLQMILAQTARAYSLGLLLMCVSWLALFIALEKNSTRWWALYVAAGVLSVYSLLFSGLVIVSQVLAVGALLVLPTPWRAMARGALRGYVVSTALTFLFVLPVGIDAAVHGGPVWVPPAHFNDVRLFIHTLAGGSHAYEYLVFATAGVAFVLAAAAFVPRLAKFTRGSTATFGAAVALGSWFTAPIVISFALTRPGLNLHLFYPRYLVVVVPPLCLLAGLAVQALPLRALQALLALALAVVAWTPLMDYYPVAQVQDFKDPMSWVQQRYQTGDGIVCDPDVECSIPVSYYLDAYAGPAHLDLDSPGRFSWEGTSTVAMTHETLSAYLANHRRVFFIYGPLGQNPTQDATDMALRADLAGAGYRLIGYVEDRGSGGVTTKVYLYEQ
jgi:mannosyltransferase